MSDDGERTCPLCAEEMDLTDQQLKPCKCGYDICVWCWHHLNDMAEKEDMEGRCPACRTPYDKEKIVGMASNCGRIMAEINADRKQKPQKSKPRTSAESRKHLTSVRVIQRSLVYIVGLPHNLCDESLLERKEYFGQYGKVLKVSISRAGAASQQASNNSTFSVYITYTKEEEAVRCIQAVHNFVLEGKPLRACFGTTKYCHAWLRNMTCSNPDCLYLHDIGSQEDSFTKDEVISAYSRSRVPQVALNNVQRSGNVLPPPSDDFSNCGTISGKQNPPSQVKGSNGISGKSTVLPATASWGSRVSNGRTASMPCSQSSVKQNLETATCASLLSSFNENTKQTSAWHDDVEPTSKLPEGRHVMHMIGISRPIESAKLNSRSDRQTIVSGVSSETFMEAVCSAGDSAWDDDVLTVSKIPKERQVIHLDGRSSSLETSILDNGEECQTSGSNVLSDAVSDAACTSVISMSCSSSPLAPSTEDKKRGIVVPTNNGNPVNSTSPQGLIRHSISSGTDKVSNGCTGANRDIQIVCSGLSSVKIDSHLGFDRLHMDLQQSSVSNLCSTTMPRNPASRFEQSHSEHEEECSASARLIKIPSLSDTLVSERPSDWGSEPRKQFSPSTGNEIDDSFVAGDNECHRLPGVINQTSCTPYLNHHLDATRHSSNNFSNGVESTCHSVNGEFSFVDTNVDRALFPFRENECTLSNRHMDGSLSSYSDPGKSFKCSDVHYPDEKAKCLGIFDDADNIYETTSPDVGDSRFISDILSLDFDPWDESSSSANNFAKLLGETDKQDGSFKSSSSLKLQNSNQSRFPFARPENQERDLQSSLRDIVNLRKACSSLQDSYGDGFQNAPPFNTFQGPNSMVNSNPVNSSGKPFGVSRGKISAPPGFSVPTKVPPPGFSSQDRYDQAHNTTYSENHLLAGPYGNQYQVHSAANTGDVEFIDPAILAVGKGRIPLAVNNRSLSSRSTFPSQFSMLENDSRLQLLMQQSISSHTNMPRPDYVGDNFLSFNDAFVTSQLLSQNHSSLSPFAQLQQPTNSRILSSQWDGWNLQTGNGVSMTEIMRNERFRPNNYFPSNEEHNFHIPSSGDLYNRAFGM